MTMLRLYNSLTKTKEEFSPLHWALGSTVPEDKRKVRMYVCGPTVYDFAHIGNARPVIVFDVLFRLLRHVYGESHVTYVRNITDVDDKINARAAQEYPSLPLNEAIAQVTKKTEKQFLDDVKALGALDPDEQPRATAYIDQMKTMIEKLILANHAYPAKGHVLFDVSSKGDYGKLSRRSLDEMIAGARVEVAPYKKNAMDFVLWKPSDRNTPGWESPWGWGRPGWHIECSAMSESLLGESFDIHGGGIDLTFPHHENEIAQSEGAHHGHPFAKVWMHNGFLQVEGEKMSKSLGNFFTIDQILRQKIFGGRRWSADVVRLAMLQTHYRQPIDWTVSALEQSEARLQRWRNFASSRVDSKINKLLFNQVLESLSDDLNTPAAFALIDQAISSSKDLRDRYTVYKLLRFFGFKGPASRALKLANELKRCLTKLPSVKIRHHSWSSNDWTHSFESDIKNESVDLVIVLAGLEHLISSLEPKFLPALPPSLIREYGDHLFKWGVGRGHVFTPLTKSKDFERYLEGVAGIPSDNWNAMAENVCRNPFLKNGKLKSATKLVATMSLLRTSLCEMESVQLFNSWISEKIELRLEVRKVKDFKESDRIRDELMSKGVFLKDGPSGTTWEVKR